MAYKLNLIFLLLIVILSLFVTSCDSYSQEINKPIICLTFDDGHLNAYENAFPLLEQYGYTATTFINSGMVGNLGRVSWNQIKNLADHDWEIAGHTIDHVDLAEVTYEEAYYQIVEDYHNFTNQGLELASFALPGGHATLRDYDIIKGLYKNIRNSIDKDMYIPLNRFDLGYFAYQTQYNPEMVKQRIIRACNNGQALVIIGFHRVSDNPTLAVDNCTIKDFEDIIAWIYDQNFQVMTMKNAVNKLNDLD